AERWGDRVCLDAARLAAFAPRYARAPRGDLRMARLRPFPRQDFSRPGDAGRARGPAAGALADGMAQSGEWADVALYRLARLRDRRHARRRGANAPARAD